MHVGNNIACGELHPVQHMWKCCQSLTEKKETMFSTIDRANHQDKTE